jgi:DNA-binding helix-hairpin-helix protein with protein kinase domain
MPLSVACESQLDLRARIALAAQLARKVSFIHARRFVIGDFAAENLLWHSASDSISFIDVDSWGYLGFEGRGGRLGSTVREPAIPVGQLPRSQYMPSGATPSHVDQSSDNYALGVTVCQILTGVHPFQPASRAAPTQDLETNMATGASWLSDPAAYILDELRFPEGRHAGLDFFPADMSAFVRAVVDPAAGEPASAHEWERALTGLSVVTCGNCQQEMLADAVCNCSGDLPPGPVPTPPPPLPAPHAWVPSLGWAVALLAVLGVLAAALWTWLR